jgi:hypothetical protein
MVLFSIPVMGGIALIRIKKARRHEKHRLLVREPTPILRPFYIHFPGSRREDAEDPTI